MSCLNGSSSEGQREGGIQDSNRVDAYLPLHPLCPPNPPRWSSRQEATPKQTTFEKRLSLPLSALDMAARKVDGMKQPRGCGNILPNNDRSEMCFQRRRVRTWYIHSSVPGLLSASDATTCNSVRGFHVRRHWRHKAPHKRSRGPGAVVRIPIKCPGFLDTARLRDGTRDLGSELGLQGSCLSMLLMMGVVCLLALFLAEKWDL